MKKYPRIFIVIVVTLFPTCFTLQVFAGDNIQAFIELLVKSNDPLLSEYKQFSGNNDPSELELLFELEKCKSKGWKQSSKECINYIHDRWHSPDENKALFLSWVRKEFLTAESKYRIISTKKRTEGFKHNLILVEIGNNRFLLFQNTEPGNPTGLIIGISEINGRKIKEYLKK